MRAILLRIRKCFPIVLSTHVMFAFRRRKKKILSNFINYNMDVVVELTTVPLLITHNQEATAATRSVVSSQRIEWLA